MDGVRLAERVCGWLTCATASRRQRGTPRLVRSIASSGASAREAFAGARRASATTSHPVDRAAATSAPLHARGRDPPHRYPQFPDGCTDETTFAECRGACPLLDYRIDELTHWQVYDVLSTGGILSALSDSMLTTDAATGEWWFGFGFVWGWFVRRLAAPVGRRARHVSSVDDTASHAARGRSVPTEPPRVWGACVVAQASTSSTGSTTTARYRSIVG